MNIRTNKSTKLIKDLFQKRYVMKFLEELKKYDAKTLEHSIRVGTLAADIGYENGLSEKEVRTLAIAGLLHDIGKCDISHDILDKKGPLNEAEQKEMDKHAVYGKKRITGHFLRTIREIVMRHHDLGSRGIQKTAGRIKRRKGSIPYYTEVVTAADIFDALKSARPYKRAFSKAKVAIVMEKEFSGDQKLVKQLLERY